MIPLAPVEPGRIGLDVSTNWGDVDFLTDVYVLAPTGVLVGDDLTVTGFISQQISIQRKM